MADKPGSLMEQEEGPVIMITEEGAESNKYSDPDVDVERLEPAKTPHPPATDTAIVPLPGSSRTIRDPDFSAILVDLDIPDGVDPSFLASLPEDMRAEVIEEQRRLVRDREQAPAQPPPGTAAQGMQEVNLEFLAAPPPIIQEEVLAQQRLEQQRQNESNKEAVEMVEDMFEEEKRDNENVIVKSSSTLKGYTSNLYQEAGAFVEEQEDEISLVRYSSLLSDKVAYIINEVLTEHPLHFELQPFQLVALHALGSGLNVILVAPTGAGKMIVAYLAILVLQKTMAVPEGVGIGCQPLSSIMEERLKKPYIPTGVITMRGDLKSSMLENGEDDDIVLSGPVEDFKTGRLKLLLGHAESWVSKTAQDILDSLREKGLVVLTIVDEAHIPVSDHWDSFRPQLKLVPGQLRGRAVKGAPTLAMMATLTPAEVKELETSLGLRSNTVLLKANPIQEHHKFVRWVHN